MKITVLTYVDPADGRDEVVDQVVAGLSARQHRVDVLEVHDDLAALIDGIRSRRPDLVFNLCEMFGSNLQGDAHVASLLELLEVPFTGCGAADLFLVQDKGSTKKVLAFEDILFPRFAIFTPDAGFETGGNLRPPLFVKPLRGDASLGIESGAEALVRDTTALMERVLAIHKEQKDAALAEEYIEGRELYVGVIGNGEPEALPPVELDLSGLPDHMPPVADNAVKFDEELGEKYGVEARIAELPDELRARVQKVAVQAYRALRVRDYGRVDLRLTEAGEIYVIEVNANCYLEQDSEFAMAAAEVGYDYPTLLDRIAHLARERFGHRPLRAAKKAKGKARARAAKPAEVVDLATRRRDARKA